ncbi:MAG: prepilin-type N-terminal cleavage/methylation domain-containing protein [Patescibacteria group bacterium]
MDKRGFTLSVSRQNMAKNKNINNKAEQINLLTGFTLIELIVALGVFSVAIFMSTSTFLNLQNAERKVQNEVNLQDNLRFGLEMMAKEIRTGRDYHCGFSAGVGPLDCPAGDSSLTFQTTQLQSVIYRQIDSRIQKSTDGGASFQPLTSGDVLIEDLAFIVSGAASGDSLQPRILISIKASVQTKGTKKELSLQTLVSQRKLAP